MNHWQCEECGHEWDYSGRYCDLCGGDGQPINREVSYSEHLTWLRENTYHWIDPSE